MKLAVDHTSPSTKPPITETEEVKDSPIPSPDLSVIHVHGSTSPPPIDSEYSEISTKNNVTTKAVVAEKAEGLPTPDRALLAKLEEANRKIEADSKCPSLNAASRKNSETSLASATSSQEDTRVAGSSEEEIWILWGRIVSNWETEWRRRNQFVRDLVRRGVPHHFRGIVWQLLAGVECSPEKKQYASYIKAKSACEKVIRRDIARTYPEHDFFKEKDGLGQEALFNVMKAYSLHDREVGYCQGSGFIVGLLLMQMPEEEAFAVLVKIMQQHKMRDMFKPSMAELGLCMYQLENLLQEILPDLHVHFQSQSFSTSIYASSWFLTLFTTNLSLPLACRIMDVFLSEGIEVVFKVALALLTLGKEHLLSLDMENLLKYIQKELPVKADADHDAFMELAYSIKVNPKKMKKLEKEYTVIKTKEQSDIAVLRCLREENRILKKRMQFLEQECSELAARLVRGQVDRAHGEEETFALERELHALRCANLDAQQALADAHEEIRSLEVTLAECNSRQSSLEGGEGSEGGEGCSGGSGDKEELARCLQQELVRAKLQLAEREAAERELAARLADLENDNKLLRKQTVDNNVAHLQDELIAVKLREAEANLSLKELRQRVTELADAWRRHLQVLTRTTTCTHTRDRGLTMSIYRQEHRAEAAATAAATAPSVVSDLMATPKKLLRAWEGRAADAHRVEDELMTTRIREVEALTELKELRLKEMELSAQVQVSSNQLRRQDEEAVALREALDAALARERALIARQREFQHKYEDLAGKAKYESMQASIKNMEVSQRIAELENELSECKMKTEVMAAEGELRNHNSDDSERVRELQEQVAELHAEVMRLEAWKARALGLTPLRGVSPEEDPEEDDGPKFVRQRRSSASRPPSDVEET
ncbi:ecotropic viral integration site 5 ortholog isoform X1 [Pieris brassicae]|uniref:ecotropic viral integration site 5 ortholog isoform X1 n=1 Tax=Pieris brassicae TaxID=7116 RepID=UPI001E660E16|nr:ecotropic viral integration site 5 ortholog isoform X1 [Pieris brassicae]XP_045530778.1 ecotropic viral integration site 5 ortholog isoform X1 [Pieris brassicae]XP_045530779.1 ecotropic viral integration site 5 ortholog isoform X1 [Pieris brassicae]XP_045530780.1 ecotropic viral integration site 5 ortholog isoform X1 [Pieris brassicae]